MNLKAKDLADKYEQIKICKLQTTSEQVCHGLPTQFETYLNYCKELRFEQEPDYQFLKSLFRDLFSSLNFRLDSDFDWTLKTSKMMQ